VPTSLKNTYSNSILKKAVYSKFRVHTAYTPLRVDTVLIQCNLDNAYPKDASPGRTKLSPLYPATIAIQKQKLQFPF
jgi:hypothetical protein